MPIVIVATVPAARHRHLRRPTTAWRYIGRGVVQQLRQRGVRHVPAPADRVLRPRTAGPADLAPHLHVRAGRAGEHRRAQDRGRRRRSRVIGFYVSVMLLAQRAADRSRCSCWRRWSAARRTRRHAATGASAARIQGSMGTVAGVVEEVVGGQPRGQGLRRPALRIARASTRSSERRPAGSTSRSRRPTALATCAGAADRRGARWR